MCFIVVQAAQPMRISVARTRGDCGHRLMIQVRDIDANDKRFSKAESIMAASPGGEFLPPSVFERIFNRVFGWMVGAGLGLRHNYLLEVTGRKSGSVYATPVNVLVIDDRTFLVCPRGRAQWVLNAEASGQVWLKKGSVRTRYAIRVVPEADKPELLRTYLDRFKLTVQRYFAVPAGSPASSFAPIANRYPVFELLVADTAGESGH